MNQRNYSDIKDMLISKGHQFFRGNYNLNFVAERENDLYTNSFTDSIHLVYESSEGKTIETFRGTTKPGIYGEGAILNPKWIEGIFGTFCLVPGQYLGCWQMKNMEMMDWMGSHNDIKNSPWINPYLQQVGNLTGWRDGNMDLEITKTNKRTGNWYGVNGHYMGEDETPYTYTDDNLNNWSLGCVGSPRMEWYDIAKILRKCQLVQGSGLSLTVIETKDFSSAA